MHIYVCLIKFSIPRKTIAFPNPDWPRCRPYKEPILCLCACLNAHVLVTLPIINLHSWASFGFFFCVSRGPHLQRITCSHPIYHPSSLFISISLLRNKEHVVGWLSLSAWSFDRELLHVHIYVPTENFWKVDFVSLL